MSVCKGWSIGWGAQLMGATQNMYYQGIIEFCNVLFDNYEGSKNA